MDWDTIRMNSAYVLVVVMLFVSIMIVIGSCILMGCARRRVKRAKKIVELINRKTKAEFNKIACLPVRELDAYLGGVYTNMLLISSMKDYTPTDPNGAVILYAKSLEAMLVYLGQETVHAIEYYYGEGFIERWCEVRFKILNQNGTLANIAKQNFTRVEISTSDTK